MNKWIVVCLVCASGLANAGQLYRWVDANGKVHYSDTAPASVTKSVQEVGGKAEAPPSKSQAAQMAGQSVTLFANACGAVCDQAEALLKQRGINYSVKDPTKDPAHAAEVRRLTGKLEVPVLVVGKTHLKGFEASSWNSVLDAAGYVKPANTPAP